MPELSGQATELTKAGIMAKTSTELSKFLSFVLRHKPDAIGLRLDAQGWADVADLIERANAAGTRFELADLEAVVETNDKKRFTLSDDGKRIRAAQGHSVTVELDLPPQTPPDILYHGTADRFLPSILSQGLTPQGRHQVHLSRDRATAHAVGQRHGKPVILSVDAAAMQSAGHTFHVADNGVWLTDHVPPAFLTIADNGTG